MFWNTNPEKEMDKIVEKVYYYMKDKNFESLVHGGKAKIRDILIKYEQLSGKPKNKMNYIRIIEAYMQVASLKRIGWTDKEIKNSLLSKHFEFLINYQNIDKIFEFISNDIKGQKNVGKSKPNDYISIISSISEKLCNDINEKIKENKVNINYEVLYFECYSMVLSFVDVVLFNNRHSNRADIILDLFRKTEDKYKDKFIDDIKCVDLIVSRYDDYSLVTMNKLEYYGQSVYDILSDENIIKLKNTIDGGFALLLSDFIYYYKNTGIVPKIEAIQSVLLVNIFDKASNFFVSNVVLQTVPFYLKEIEKSVIELNA